MANAIDLLLAGPMPPAVPFDERFTVHRLLEAADRAAMLAEVGGRVRALVPGGQFPVDAALIAQLPKLEIIANFGVGYDSVDVAAAHARGIVVTNTPDVLTEEVADLTIGLLLATVRQIPQADRFVREGRWRQGRFPLTASLQGRKIGIVGLGRIGSAVATRCAAFGLEISYHGRSKRANAPYAYYASLTEMAAAVDVLIVTAAGGGDTRHLVTAETLRALGPDGILINVARGSVVDEEALVAALASRMILGAGLDVFEAEPHVPEALLALDNTVLLPHAGSGSLRTRIAMGELVMANLTSWFDGRGPLTPVEAA